MIYSPMRNMHFMIAWFLIAGGWVLMPTVSLSAGLPMRPGSILAVAGFGQPHTLLELAPDGTIRAEVILVDPDLQVVSPSGLTVLKGAIWISGSSGVFQVDPATAELSSGFLTELSITALADDGEALWVGSIHPDRLSRFSTDGRLLTSITLQGNRLVTGLDTDGTRFLISSYATGHVHIFDLEGQEIGVIETDLNPGNLTGVSLDPDGDSLWLTLGTGTNEVVHSDLEGNLLGEIPGAVEGLKGLEVLASPVFADDFESGTLEAWNTAF